MHKIILQTAGPKGTHQLLLEENLGLGQLNPDLLNTIPSHSNRFKRSGWRQTEFDAIELVLRQKT